MLAYRRRVCSLLSFLTVLDSWTTRARLERGILSCWRENKYQKIQRRICWRSGRALVVALVFFADNRINSCAELIRPPLALMGKPAARWRSKSRFDDDFRGLSNIIGGAEEEPCWISWTTSSSPLPRRLIGTRTIRTRRSQLLRSVSCFGVQGCANGVDLTRSIQRFWNSKLPKDCAFDSHHFQLPILQPAIHSER